VEIGALYTGFIRLRYGSYGRGTPNNLAYPYPRIGFYLVQRITRHSVRLYRVSRDELPIWNDPRP
jgi:hypothetical protein